MSLNPPSGLARPIPRPRSSFRAFVPISTRWSDNDAYGHVNNVVYYSWFDAAVNGLLVRAGVLDVASSTTIGLVVETHCNYFEPLSFPQAVDVGVRVAHIGRSSVRYELGVFAASDARGMADDAAFPASHTAACGHFVHVYVDRATRESAQVPADVAAFLETLRA